MKKTVLTLLFAGALLVRPPAASTASLSFVPDFQTIGWPATTGDVEVRFTGVSASGPLVGGFDIVIEYNPSIVAFQNVFFGTGLGDAGAFEALESVINDVPGFVQIASVSLLGTSDLLARQPASFLTLATLRFEAVSSGISPLAFVSPTLVSGVFPGLPDPSILSLDLSPGAIQVTVPEPGTFGLLGFVLTGVWARASRRGIALRATQRPAESQVPPEA